MAVILIAVLALAFGSSPHRATSQQRWAAQASPVVQSLLGDVAALERPAPAPREATSGAVAALARDLDRAARTPDPTYSGARRAWKDAIGELRNAEASLARSPAMSPSVRADLSAAGEGLLSLAAGGLPNRPG